MKKIILLLSILLYHYAGFAQPLSGTVTVGAGGDFADFTSAAGLFQYVNDNGLDGDLNIQVLSDITELGLVSLNQWSEIPANAHYTLTIKSVNDTGKLISCNNNNIAFSINGADRVLIDGRYNGSGQYLTFSARGTVFRFSNGANDNQLRHVNINSASTNSGAVAFATGANTRNIVANCTIANRYPATDFPKHGIHTYDLLNDSIVIQNNLIYGFREAGVYIESAKNCSILSNEITSENGTRGIVCSSFDTVHIRANRIYGIDGLSPSPQNSYGIYCNFYTNSGGASQVNIVNNMIALNPPHAGNINGISLYGTNGFPIHAYVLHNSVYISGSESSARSANGVSQNNISDLTFLNNLVVNTRENTQTDFQGKSRCVSFNTNSGYSHITADHNLYYHQGMNTWVGQWNATLEADMSDWQTTSGQDAQSVHKAVFFASATDLHLAGASIGDLDLGVALGATVTEDFDGEGRHPTTYLGCDEAGTVLSTITLAPETIGMRVYPNPAQDFIYIEAEPSRFQAMLYNLSGQCLLSSDQPRLDIRSLSKGIYWLYIRSAKGTAGQKIVLQ